MDKKPTEKGVFDTNDNSSTDNWKDIRSPPPGYEQCAGSGHTHPPGQEQYSDAMIPLAPQERASAPEESQLSPIDPQPSQPQAVLLQPVVTVRAVPLELDEEGDEDVPDYLGLAICSLCCCLCLGGISVMHAVNARSLKAEGKFEAARAKSSKAQTYATIAIILGIAVTLFRVVLMLTNNSEDDQSHY